MKARAMSKAKDLRWLVRERSQNQQLLLDLTEFGRKARPDLMASETVRPAFHYLVGAGFSLWRAVFLAEQVTDTARLVDDSQQFLETLVADNAIGYQHDKNLRAWSAGYYLNNAFFRIDRVIVLLVGGRRNQPKAFRRFSSYDRYKIVSGDRHVAWRLAHDAACQALKMLQTELGRSPKTGRKRTW